MSKNTKEVSIKVPKNLEQKVLNYIKHLKKKEETSSKKKKVILYLAENERRENNGEEKIKAEEIAKECGCSRRTVFNIKKENRDKIKKKISFF